MRSDDSLRGLTKRRLMLALALFAAALVSLAALGAAGNWRFFQNHGSTPASAPNAVKAGEWSGHPWQLIAYPSSAHGLCVSVTPAGSNADDFGGGTACSPFAGVPPTAETKESSEMTITFLGGAASDELPAYIAGPVIDKASTIEITVRYRRDSQAADVRRTGIARARPLLCDATASIHSHAPTRSTHRESAAALAFHQYARRPRPRWERRCLPRPADGRGRLLTPLGLPITRGTFPHTGPGEGVAQRRTFSLTSSHSVRHSRSPLASMILNSRSLCVRPAARDAEASTRSIAKRASFHSKAPCHQSGSTASVRFCEAVSRSRHKTICR